MNPDVFITIAFCAYPVVATTAALVWVRDELRPSTVAPAVRTRSSLPRRRVIAAEGPTSERDAPDPIKRSLDLDRRLQTWLRDRALLFGVPGSLLAISILVYLAGRLLLRDKWPDLWMPAFIATWTGFIVAFPILEYILEQQRQREHEREVAPYRYQAGSDLALALRGILIFGLRTARKYSEEPVKAAEFLSEWAKTAQWQRFATHSIEISHLAIVLRETGQGLAEFRVRYAYLLTLQEIEQMNQLERYAQDPNLTRKIENVANTVDRWPSEAGSAAPLLDICCGAAELFNPVANIYSAMTKRPLTTPARDEIMRYVQPWPELAGDDYENRVPDRADEILREQGIHPDQASDARRWQALVQAEAEAAKHRRP